MKIMYAKGIRWRICLLLFFVTTINYMDRQVFSILAPTLQTEIGWTEHEYGLIVAAFTFAYALSLFLSGRLFDFIGERKGLALAIGSWSLVVMEHALASTALGFGLVRFCLGFTEGGNYPAALKAAALWYPKHERSFATGIFNSGSNIGVVTAAISVPALTLYCGFRATFVIQGVIGLICLFVWLFAYHEPQYHRKLSSTEFAYIAKDYQQNELQHACGAATTKPLPLTSLLACKQVWAYAIGKFLTDPVWWFYLYWMPKYLEKDFSINLKALALPLIIIYILADVGSIAGGYLLMYFIKRGKSDTEARSLALLCCAIFILPTFLIPFIHHVWLVILLVSLAAAGHQAWSCNILNLPADFLPPHSVASLVGLGGFTGCMGGILFQTATGYCLEWNGNSYAPFFILCTFVYMCAWMIIRWLAFAPDQVGRIVPEFSAPHS